MKSTILSILLLFTFQLINAQKFQPEIKQKTIIFSFLKDQKIQKNIELN